MQRQFQAVAGVAAAMGTALVAAALAGAKQIDETAKSARRLDASIGGFRALELAAGEAGVSLSGLTNDIQTMNREISTIGTSGNGKRALDALALSVEDLAGKDADEKLAIIADQVKALGLDAGQTTAILRDLGVRNREMALLVLGGGEAIRSARSDIESYGLAISDVDAGRIEVANDALGRLGLIGQYAGQQLAISLVPAMGAFAVVMTDSLREGGLLRTMIDGLVGNIDVLAYSAGVAVTAFGVRYVGAFALAKLATFSLVGALTALKAALIATGIGALVVGAGYLISKFVDLVVATGGWGAALSALGDLAAGVWSGIKASAKSIAPSLNAVWSMVQSSFFGMLSHIQEKWSRFLGSLGQDLADVPGLGAFSKKLLDTSNIAAGATAEFNALAQSAANSAERLKTAASSLASQGFEEAREAAQRLSDIVSKSSDNLDDAASGLGEVESAATGGGSGGAAGGLNKTADAIAKQIKALEDAADPLRVYNRGLAELDKLKLVGLSDGAYAKGVADLTKELKDAQPEISETAKLFQDGFSDALDYTLNGFKDGFSGLLDIVKSTILQAIKFAIANPIKLSLGMGGTAGATGAGGGLGGGIQGIFSKAIGGFGGEAGGFMSTLSGGGGLASAFSGLSGGTGLLGGLGSTLSATLGTGGGIGGLFSIGANAGLAGGGLMATMGAALPVIGIAIAAISFFKKKTKVIDEGITATIDMEKAMFEGFKTIQTKRFWGLSKKEHDESFALSSAVSDPLAEAAGAVRSNVLGASDALGISASIFSGFSHSFKLSLKGLDDQAQQAKIQEALGGLGDAMAARALGVSVSGAYDELVRLSTALVTVNDVFRDLGFNLYNVSVAGGYGSAAFSDLFGSLENFTSATAAYYDQFYSTEEKLLNSTGRLTESLAALGINFLPETNAAFRDLVDTAEMAGDMDLVAGLIQLAPAFDTVTDAAANLRNELRSAYQLDSSGYATAFDAKFATELANKDKYNQERITDQNIELKRQTVILEALLKESNKQTNAAKDAQLSNEIG